MMKILKKIFFLVLFLGLIAGFFYWQGVNKAANKNSQDIVFEIKSGEGVKEIAKNLKDKGLIDSTFYFEIYSRLSNSQSSIKAGKYLLKSSFSIKDIVNFLVKGEVISNEVNITIIEGWNMRDVADYFSKENIFASKDIEYLENKTIKDWKLNWNKSDLLNDAPDDSNLEGYFFPDTYRIFKDASPDEVVNKILDNLDSKFTEQMKQDIKKQGKTIYEIITMASVIEKEVRNVEDMKTVSGLFWNRIENGQPLESCATLAFILGVDKKQYTIEDTQIDSPYNSYRNQGLPPGPICNPGINAIKAAIYPNETNYNYFLNRFDTGETIFSETYAEHLRNKDKYLK